MEIAAVIGYFEQLATSHKDIAHTPQKPKFIRINEEEGKEGMKDNFNFSTPVLVMDYPQSMVKDALSDNPHDVMQITFLLVQYAGENDYAKQVAVLDHTKEIGLQLLAKIFEDVKELVLFHGFDRNSITITPVVNYLSDNIYGQAFSFRLNASIAKPLYYNPDNWLN